VARDNSTSRNISTDIFINDFSDKGLKMSNQYVTISNPKIDIYMNSGSHINILKLGGNYSINETDDNPDKSNASIVVDKDLCKQPGSNVYCSINEAVNKARNGDKIKISSGIYNESIEINKSLTLIGVPNETIIRHQNGKIIDIKSKSVTLENISLEGEPDNTVGIKGSRCDELHLVNCSIYNCTIGINIVHSNNICIIKNKIKLLLDSKSREYSEKCFVGLELDDNSYSSSKKTTYIFEGTIGDYVGISHNRDRNCSLRYFNNLINNNNINITVPLNACKLWRDRTCEVENE